jgi:hypothetical protein
MFKSTFLKLHGEDYLNTFKTFKILKEKLNPSISNLEFLSMDFLNRGDPNLDEFLYFFSSCFSRLRTVHLWLTTGITMGELISYRRLHQALSKQAIFSELVLKVKKLTLLEKSQLKDYQALGIYGVSLPRVLRIVEMKYGILIDVAW